MFTVQHTVGTARFGRSGKLSGAKTRDQAPLESCLSAAGRTCAHHRGAARWVGAYRLKAEASSVGQAGTSVEAPGHRRNRPAIAALDKDSFPILERTTTEGKQLVYLDSAATSQKPLQVIEALSHFYRYENANVHRGAHRLSQQATEAFESARAKVARFLNAKKDTEIVFTRNATEAINTVAYAWGLLGGNLTPGDEIIVSVAEHHANLVPWQLVAQRTGARLRHIPLLPQVQALDMDTFEKMLSERTKLVAIAYVGNVLGYVQDVRRITELAHQAGASVLVDACQAVPHMPVDVQDIGCEWLVASGHKMCGPTGIGILYGKEHVLRREMAPFLGGGEMIAEVFLDHSTFADLPHKFEAGTPSIGDAVALGAAIDYLEDGLGGMKRIHQFELQLARYLYESLEQFQEISIYGPPLDNDLGLERAALCAFNVRGVHPSDLATIIDLDGIAIRAGHHCAQPLHRDALGVGGSARASVYVYNSSADIDRFIDALVDAVSVLGEKLTLRPA
ncbi:cysteine desulfurase for iron-sulfur cluster formation sufS [Cyanidioschyzon merolae strain 10D]|uniref:cysteine desulfurase n=1 Tax=Cyanidioschyzon merolae (strain NIES-3377 / 10D) TaxID=280699 RepID=M1V4W8_CYAM1|nr:cysteine desulfurase for iron-sulfur cluster formation sufS [Cyanidioschyzon merolae strain 10D]BAM79720.1 cysteine desulfurase for iron-sulfur cluster formation sufS [Cyanidioschyzon merolae strain 10D]|eukprot:XP_005536006.1 cysteine desulfurase for iron-sulfur cluster formation sufS [Cyanidioschyzon merolae strain 10D]